MLFLWEAHPWEPEVLLLLAARGGETGGPGIQVPARTRRLMEVWGKRARAGVPAPPLDGEVVMRELGVESGPLLGKVLREVRLAWEAGLATTREEALSVAREALRQARQGGAESG